jgi:hypothetical protein
MSWHYACIKFIKPDPMVKNEEQLRQDVILFLKEQPSYNEKKKIKVICNEGDQYFILYGEDMQTGIAGFGSTAENALDDFIDNWNFYTKRQNKTERH